MRRLGRAQKINSTTTGTVAGGTVTPSKGRGRNKLAGVYTRTGGCRPATRGGQTRPWRQKLGYSAADLLGSADGARTHTPVCPGRCEILPNAAAYGRSAGNGQTSVEFRKFNPIKLPRVAEGPLARRVPGKASDRLRRGRRMCRLLIAKILGAAVKTARQNTARLKNLPKS